MDSKQIFSENLRRHMELSRKTRKDISESLGISYGGEHTGGYFCSFIFYIKKFGWISPPVLCLFQSNSDIYLPVLILLFSLRSEVLWLHVRAASTVP